MTRINTVPVEELCNQHLFAEYREMPRIVSSFWKGNFSGIPEKFVLGTGHMKFFWNKFKWLHKRHQEIVTELIRREYDLGRTDSDIFAEVPSCVYNDWEPDADAIALSRDRITERLPAGARWSKAA